MNAAANLPASVSAVRKLGAAFTASVILPAAAVVVPLAILGVVGLATWRSTWSAAEADMQRAAQSVSEYGQRSFETYRLAIQRANDVVAGLSDEAIRQNERALHNELVAIARDVQHTDTLSIVDRFGVGLVTSVVYPMPTNVTVADRDYFKTLRASERPDIYVSTTFVSRLDGTVRFAVAERRWKSGNGLRSGAFDGTVHISIKSSAVAVGLRRLLAAPNDRVAFVRADGYGLVSTSGVPEVAEVLPKVQAESPFYRYANAKVESALYLSTTAVPGSASILAMHMIDGFPIYAISIRRRSDVVAAWWDAVVNQLAFGIPATLGLFLMALRVQRDQKRLRSANAVLQTENELGTSRLDRARRFGLVGTFEYDLRTGESLRSPEYMAIHGMPAVTTTEKHDDWAARLHPDDRQRAEVEILAALGDPSVKEYGQTYRIVSAKGDVRWIAARGQIQRDEAGQATMLLGAHVDVTPLRTTELALAESDARLRLAQEAVGIGTWEWVQATHVLTFSKRLLEIWGFDVEQPRQTMAAVLSRIHPDDRAELRGHIRNVRNTGGFRCEFRVLRSSDETHPDVLWVSARATWSSADLSGSSRLMGIAWDISDRKRSEEMTILMAREVEHRAKNAFSLIASLLRMTKAGSAEELARLMNQRVQALSATLSLLGRNRWKGAQLHDLVKNTLAPFAVDKDGRQLGINIDGPPVEIAVDAAQPLSMALHELTTNAVKYGALSVPEGHLDIRWRVAGERLHLTWTERGGPRLAGPPPQLGFGSKLILMLFEGQLHGKITKRWEEAGLVAELNLPLKGTDARNG